MCSSITFHFWYWNKTLPMYTFSYVYYWWLKWKKNIDDFYTHKRNNDFVFCTSYHYNSIHAFNKDIYPVLADYTCIYFIQARKIDCIDFTSFCISSGANVFCSLYRMLDWCLIKSLNFRIFFHEMDFGDRIFSWNKITQVVRRFAIVFCKVVKWPLCSKMLYNS